MKSILKIYKYSDWGVHIIVLCAGVWGWSGVDREFIFRELFKFNRGGDSGLHAGAFYGDSLIQGYTHALALINLLSVWIL